MVYSIFKTTTLLILGAGIIAAKGISDDERRAPLSDKRNKRIQSKVDEFAAQDRVQTPRKGGILFVGSSSIRQWNLDAAFPNMKLLKRGIGGTQISETLQFADQLILSYQPSQIVIYTGDNDIGRGRTADQVHQTFQDLVEKILRTLPSVHITYLSIKPSIKRWHLVEEMSLANEKIRLATLDDDRLLYLDVGSALLGQDGKPMAKVFKADGLHLNDAGYALWNAILKPHLRSVTPASTTHVGI